MANYIERQAAIDALGGNEPVGDPSKMDDDDVVKMWERIRIINIINKLPSAQPEYNLTESCADCKEYDHERHCCPRWNKVIKRTVEDLESAHAWHECFEDDPDSFPDDDRNVLVSFSNFSLSIIGQWRVDESGAGCWYLGDTDETFLSEDLFVDGWWGLPKKPERRE